MPLLEKHIKPRRGIWQITEDSDMMLSKLDKKEIYLSYLGTITKEKRKQEWLAARLLLKELLGEELPIHYYSDDAPFLPDSPFSISISHTKDYVAVLLTEGTPAGIDIEYRSDRAVKIKERFLSEHELKALDQSDEATHALLYWSAKEALFKMIRQEEVDFRKQLYLEPFQLEKTGVITARELKTEKGAIYTLRYEVTPFYVCVWGI